MPLPRLLLLFIFSLPSAIGQAAETLGLLRVVDAPLDQPVCVAFPPGDRQRMFVVEQHAGAVRVVRDGTLLAEPFLTVRVSDHQEQGLLGLVFDPDYQANGFVYVYYSDPAGDNVLERYTRRDAEHADPASVRRIFKLDHPDGSDVHYGSWMGFNPRDLADPAKRHWLHVTVGEGGGNNAPTAQDPASLFGKILRIDVDPARFVGAGLPPYGIPAANPELGGQRRAAFALGVRNPWRAGFDRASGDLWFGDVGSTEYEEINRIPYGTAGLNFQWPRSEGPYVHRNNQPTTVGTPAEALHAFQRGSVIGGLVYRGSDLPGWQGAYLFADYGSGTVRSLRLAGGTVGDLRSDLGNELGRRLQGGLSRVTSFAEDAAGEIYLCEYARRGNTASGMVWKVRQDTDQQPPSVTSEPPRRAVAGAPWRYVLSAEGNPAPALTLVRGPQGMALADGALTWTPGEQQIGAFEVVVQARNKVPPDAMQTFTLTVAGQRAPEYADGPGGKLPAELAPGVLFSYYEGDWGDVPETAALTALRSGTADTISLDPQHREDDFALRFSGYVHASRGGVHVFSTTSDDGSKLWIGDDLVVDNGGTHGARTVEGGIGLAPGWHRLTVVYHEKGGGQQLAVSWREPGAKGAVTLPAAALARPTNPPGLDSYAGGTPYLRMPHTLAGDLPGTLSGTGAFSDIERLVPDPSLIAYDVNAALWSDGAGKQRWLMVPRGKRIGFSADGNWTFPAGSVLVKHFTLGSRRLETRLLVVQENGTAYGVTYRWRPDGRDADLLDGGAPVTDDIAVGGARQPWTYPSRANCLQCHTASAGFVLGPRTRQLNREVAWPSGRRDNQLRTLGRVGVLDDAYREADLAKYQALAALDDVRTPLEHRVRSYLDANCMMCHQPGGGAQAGFDARFTTPLARQGLIAAPPVNALGLTGAQVVAPGDKDHSLLWLRLVSADPAVRMPTIGRSVVDPQAREVVGQWIEGMAKR